MPRFLSLGRSEESNHGSGLLRPRRKRPGSYRACNDFDKITPLHAPPIRTTPAMPNHNRLRLGGEWVMATQPSGLFLSVGAMSALGQKQTCAVHQPMSA